MRKVILISLSLFILISCGTSYIPPKKYDVVKSKEFDKSYDEVWANIIAYFGENNIPIENLEKASGFIKAKSEKKYSVNKLYLDCGQTSSRVSINELTISCNITVRKSNPIKVTINTFTEVAGMNVKYYDVHCNSTGAFENEIFEYIESN